MGLAASQARFLAITSRKMNCEFRSMELAQQKLSVTRDLQKASKDYQSALDASKLVWEVENGDVYDLSYDLMMTPSMLNEYDPYLLTDKTGKIILSNAMFNAAVSAGIIDKSTGNPNSTDGSFYTIEKRNAFLNALGVANLVPAATITSITNLGDSGYSATAGLGGEVLDKVQASAMNTNTFINYLKTATKTSETSKKDELAYTVGWDNLAVLLSENEKATLADIYCSDSSPGSKKNSGTAVTDKIQIRNSQGRVLTIDEVNDLTLGDLISGQYTLTYISKEETNGAKFGTILEELSRGFYDADADKQGLLETDNEAIEACKAAYELTQALLLSTDKPSSKGNGSSAISTGASSAQNSNKMQSVKASVYQDGGNSKSDTFFQTISLTNTLKSYLTYYAAAMDDWGSDLYVDRDSTKKSKYVTDDLSYTFVIHNDNAVSEMDMLNADFYNMLFNNICMYGASSDQTMREQVSDSEYLNYAIKNGQLFISSLNTDGYFYQGHYTLNGHVQEIPDEEAIARAEVEYNITKSKLNYKEETLELEMKNLDMEISSLSTEYETVKNLISKNVEKVFTMFSS